MAWLPPLLFSALVEANVAQSYGLIAVSGFFSIGALILKMAAPWDEILEETRNASFLPGKVAAEDEAAVSTDSGSDQED